MPEAFERVIVQVHMRDLNLIQIERVGVHRESMVVGGDLHLARDFIDDRMIRTSMSELELVGFRVQRQTQHLVTKTDSENRCLPDQLSDLRCLMRERLRIARTIREKNTIRSEREHVFR